MNCDASVQFYLPKQRRLVLSSTADDTRVEGGVH
jgi:hypothetical protein